MRKLKRISETFIIEKCSLFSLFLQRGDLFSFNIFFHNSEFFSYFCTPNLLGRFLTEFHADVMKLVDMLDLGSSAARFVGSSPSIRTILMA